MKRSMWLRATLVWAVVCLFQLALLGVAEAGELGDAKRAGFVGERYDGSLGLVQADAPERYRALVAEINEKRGAEYRKLANKQQIPVEKVAEIAGEKLIGRARPGEFVMRSEGSWQQVGE